MKKMLALLFTVSLIFGVADQVRALSIDILEIKSTTHPYVWDTIDNNSYSPIGVSINGGSSIVQSPPTSQSIVGRVSIDPGQSVLLFTEAKYAPWMPNIHNDFFTTETYTLTIKADSTTYTGTFGFGTYKAFSVSSQPIPFTLEFLGFTDDSESDSLVDKVGPYPGGLNFGLTANGTADAVYRLTYNAVPEPTTLLLLGIGLIGLAGLSRKKFLK